MSSPRTGFDEAHFRTNMGTDGLALFDPPPIEKAPPAEDEPSLRPGWMETWAAATPAERATQRERWKLKLEPLLAAMFKAVPHGRGVTAAELTDEAMKPTLCSGVGIILPAVPATDPRAFSFIGPWLGVLAKQGKIGRKTARIEGGGSVHLKREAQRDAAHSNDGFIYLPASGAASHG
jgi:hypothetical protein